MNEKEFELMKKLVELKVKEEELKQLIKEYCEIKDMLYKRR